MTTASGITEARGDARRRDDLILAGALLLVGFVANGIQGMLLHPSGAEDDHEGIFTEYADSDVWVATHLAEFVLVLVAFAGLLVLCRVVWREAPYLAQHRRPNSDLGDPGRARQGRARCAERPR